MRFLGELIVDSNLLFTNIYIRNASRSIMFDDNNLVMLKSKKYGDIKFPGGGIEGNETIEEALNRELLEETGIKAKEIKPFGKLVEYRQAIDGIHDTVIMNNYFFTCKIDEETNYRNLDQYEQEYGYEVIRISINDAIKCNEKLLNNNNIPWVKREIYILKYLLNKGE